ncbi:MAG: TonB-dependent receptor [Gammaproteobacteria bacterium]|nr:MAG: TonB-dependent receptor [Gammaproteobacteria bacterium]
MKFLRIILAAATLAAATNIALAQEQPAGAPGATAAPTEEVIITGTRRTDRTLTESSAPIDVLNGNDLAIEPSGSMMDTLSSLVPSFIVGQNSISDASSFVRSPSLRGLPADEMLVMLDGKRYNRSALVQVFYGGETALAFGSQGPDLGAIPSIAIKSLEILRDGASAQYGSDAIAGVLNYQLRDNSSGIELTSRLGGYFPTGYSRDGTDRQVAGNLGLPLGGQGFVNLSVEWSKYDQTVRNATRPTALAFAAAFPNLASQLPHYPGPVQQWGTPPSDGVKAMINSGITLDNGAQLYFFSNYANIQANESFNYRLPKSVPRLPQDVQGSSTTWSHHAAFGDIYLDACTSQPTYTGCPAGGWIKDNNVFNFGGDANGAQLPAFPNAPFYPAGFTPRFYGTTQEFFGTVGYKGTTSTGLHYDVSGSSAQNSLAESLRSTVNPSLGPLSPENFYVGKFVQRESNLNIDLSYPWRVAGLASPVSVAGGLEYRDETYQQLLGDPASYASGVYGAPQPLYSCTGTSCTPALDSLGNQIVAGGVPTQSNGYGGIGTGIDASQISYGAYLDLEADVLRWLTLGLAGRYEDYSSFGSTTLGKLQARAKATDWLAFRATASTGFHAPTPGQSNVETISTTFLPGSPTNVQIGTYPVTSSIARYYGATALRPEESTNLAAGVVFTLPERTLVTVDGYSIAVRHRIGISQQFKVMQADIANLPDLATVGAGGVVQYFTNGFDTRTTGLDVVGSRVFYLGSYGQLSTQLAYNYNTTSVPTYDKNVIDQARIVNIKHYAPNTRVNLNLDYRMGPFEALVHENYYGTYQDEYDYPGQLFSAKYITDLDLAYEAMKNVTVGIGGRNIFNVFPDKLVTLPPGTPFASSKNAIYPSSGGEVDGEVYPRTGGPFGYNGAFWYARVAVKF